MSIREHSTPWNVIALDAVTQTHPSSRHVMHAVMFQRSLSVRLCDPSDLRRSTHADQIAVSLDKSSHERAIQALRDVRHMLPRDGVAIVDAVLFDATSFVK